MKIKSLKIKRIRGIKELSLNIGCENFVVWGPNGSGKSAVVDAVDFLLTGSMTRLEGIGTEDITLEKHGPHIDHEAKDAVVTALVKIPGVSEEIKLERGMETKVLVYDKKYKAKLESILQVAQQGQNVLTRREILKYITSPAGSRAVEIQTLLNVGEIEQIRSTLVSVKNKAGRDSDAAKQRTVECEKIMATLLDIKMFSRSEALKKINEIRTVLNAVPIKSMESDQFKSGITPSAAVVNPEGLNVSLFEKDVTSLIALGEEKITAQHLETFKALMKSLAEVQKDKKSYDELRCYDLVETGMTLIPDNGECPLCNKDWEPGKLKVYLEQRLEILKASQEISRKIKTSASSIVTSIAPVIQNLKKIKSTLVQANLNDRLTAFSDWETDLNLLRTALLDPVGSLPQPQWDAESVSCLLLNEKRTAALNVVKKEVREKYPEASPEQKAWDMLTRCEENTKAFEAAMKSQSLAEKIDKRAEVLYEKFIANRDAVLGNLYDSIKERFVELYKVLHGLDEKDFSARLEPQEAKLTFEVDFHGRGAHPPHALHSEGHQDSMGLCLYLALSEKLTKGLVDIIILDDVVTSVDADHRKQVCKLLKQYFPGKQFIITTHERVWANQLQHEGVVNRSGMVEFYNWHVDTGPTVNLISDLWGKIEEDLKKADVSSAASRLRRGLEQFMAMMCDYLGAPVTYRLDGRYELGDFMNAIGRYKRLLAKAMDSANSWKNTVQANAIQEHERLFADAVTKTQCEQWAINQNVHYEKWANFSARDFKPVIDSFKKLTSLFVCGVCGAPVHIVMENHDATMIKCDCGKVSWSLISKKT